MAHKTITIKGGQSLLDVALEHYGDALGVFYLTQDNPQLLSILDNLKAGETLDIRDTVLNAEIVRRAKRYGIHTLEGDRAEGIGFWQIGMDFIVT